MTRDELQQVRDWADHKISQGNDPPWSWYQHMKLREAIDAILSGMASTVSVTVPEELPQEAERRGIGHLRLVDSDRQGSVPPGPSSDEIPLPM